MGRVVIKRQSAYSDRLRAYKIFLDDKQVGQISNNETLSFDCSDGSHSLYLKIDWCSCQPIEFNSNAEFECQSNITGWKIPFAIFFLFMPTRWIRLERRS